MPKSLIRFDWPVLLSINNNISLYTNEHTEGFWGFGQFGAFWVVLVSDLLRAAPQRKGNPFSQGFTILVQRKPLKRHWLARSVYLKGPNSLPLANASLAVCSLVWCTGLGCVVDRLAPRLSLPPLANSPIDTPDGLFWRCSCQALLLALDFAFAFGFALGSWELKASCPIHRSLIKTGLLPLGAFLFSLACSYA